MSTILIFTRTLLVIYLYLCQTLMVLEIAKSKVINNLFLIRHQAIGTRTLIKSLEIERESTKEQYRNLIREKRQELERFVHQRASPLTSSPCYDSRLYSPESAVERRLLNMCPSLAPSVPVWETFQLNALIVLDAQQCVLSFHFLLSIRERKCTAAGKFA